MIDFKHFQLKNGLNVCLSQDMSSSLVAVNILYGLGSKHDPIGKSGLAHLLEHMMFAGTTHIQDIDSKIQLAGGENNAFTNQDITNYYGYVPIDNLELLLYIEADRMVNLTLDEAKFRTQKQVVIEEYKESVLTEPYADFWHHLGVMAFPHNGYCWPTIGANVSDIESIERQHIKSTYQSMCPSNAFLSICGPIDYKQGQDLVHQYFDTIEKTGTDIIPITAANIGLSVPERIKIIKKEVPEECVFLAFPMVSRRHPDYYIFDVLSDLLCQGKSSWLYEQMVTELEVLSHVDAWISGNEDEGLILIEMRLHSHVGYDKAMDYFWTTIKDKMNETIHFEKQLSKVKNKIETNLAISETSIVTKAMSLSFYNHIDRLNEINRELDQYRSIQRNDVLRILQDSILNIEPYILVYQRP